MWESKARTAIAEAFLAALQEEQIPWRQCWSASPVSMSSGKPYKGINNLMLSWVAHQKGYKDTRWMTYKYAQDHGWQVRKGEKSVRVEYWQHYDYEAKKALTRDEVIRIQREEPERMEHIRLVAYTANVFNVEQVAGDIPPRERAETIQDPAALKRCRNAFLANLGVSFGEGGDRAYYSPTFDKIQMPYAETFTGDYAYMCTLLHEAGHATGHPNRLGRDMSGGFGSPEYAKEELRAEIASAFAAQALRLPYKGDELDFEMENHKAYIQSWISALKKDPNELFAAIKDADQIADYLLEHGKLLELAEKASIQSNFAFEYSLLYRLRSDCEYFLNNGKRCEKHLWAGNVRDQIVKMRELYDLLPIKPDWLTPADLNNFAVRMKPQYQVIVYHSTENGLNEMIEYQSAAEAEAQAQAYLDGTNDPDGFRYEGAAVFNLQSQRLVRVLGNFPAEQVKQAEAALQRMSIDDLSQEQMDELKSRIFWNGENQERICQSLRPEQIKALEEAQSPEEIPDEIVKELYEGIDSTPDEFFCSCKPAEIDPEENQEEDQMEI